MDQKRQMESQWPQQQQQQQAYGQAVYSPGVQVVHVNTGRPQYINPVKYPLYFNRWRALFLVIWIRLTIDLFSIGPFLLWIMNLQIKNVLYFRFHWFLWLAHVMVHLLAVIFGLMGHKNNQVNWIYGFIPCYIAYFALRITELTMIFNFELLWNLFAYLVRESSTRADEEIIRYLVNVYLSIGNAIYISFAMDAAFALTAAVMFAHKLRQITKNY